MPSFSLRWFVWVLVLCGLGLASCVQPGQERLQYLNDDGVFLFEQGNYATARQSFELALQKQPENDTLLYNLGQCEDRLGRYKEAEERYRQCLQQNPQHGPCRQSLALLMYREGKRGDADELIQGWLREQPKLAAAFAADGWRLRHDGDLLQAQARLQQALEREPNNVAALTELGIVFELLERPDRALVLYEKALATEPRRTDLQERVNVLLTKGVKPPLPD